MYKSLTPVNKADFDKGCDGMLQTTCGPIDNAGIRRVLRVLCTVRARSAMGVTGREHLVRSATSEIHDLKENQAASEANQRQWSEQFVPMESAEALLLEAQAQHQAEPEAQAHDENQEAEEETQEAEEETQEAEEETQAEQAVELEAQAEETQAQADDQADQCKERKHNLRNRRTIKGASRLICET
jgi:hypothetical protein